MKDSAKGRFLRKYTELPFLIDLLQTQNIVLVNPKFWDDRNDSYYLEQYGASTGMDSVFCLCLTQTNETYHHWRVFSNGPGGVCIEFNKSLFMGDISNIPDLRAEPVIYRTLKQLRDTPPRTESLPFLKRYAFSDEMEFRLFMAKESHNDKIVRIPVKIRSINRIMLSPWLPKSVAASTKKALRSMRGCSKLKIYRSTLVENEDWKKFAYYKNN